VLRGTASAERRLGISAVPDMLCEARGFFSSLPLCCVLSQRTQLLTISGTEDVEEHALAPCAVTPLHVCALRINRFCESFGGSQALRPCTPLPGRTVTSEGWPYPSFERRGPSQIAAARAGQPGPEDRVLLRPRRDLAGTAGVGSSRVLAKAPGPSQPFEVSSVLCCLGPTRRPILKSVEGQAISRCTRVASRV